LLDTSTENDFDIEGATFEENSARSSAVILIKANGAFNQCKFVDNTATDFTQNIFMSLSTITIENSRFSD
jgi:hypothetical protein